MSISREKLKKLKPVTVEDDERMISAAKKGDWRERSKQRRIDHPEYFKQYYTDNAEEIKKKQAQYRIEHKEEMSKQRKETKKEYDRRFEKWKQNNPEQFRIHHKRNRWKRKNFGYEEILPTQWGCVQHHVDDIHVIPIPTVVHQMFSGYSRKKHREFIDEWMQKVRPDLWLLTHL